MADRDSETCASTRYPGSTFIGADFGYQPPGLIGDRVWNDLNTTMAPAAYDNTAAASSDQTGQIDDDGDIGQDTDTPAGRAPEGDEDVTVATPTPVSYGRLPDS